MDENLFATVQNGPHHLFWNPLPAASSKPPREAPPKEERWRQIERQRQRRRTGEQAARSEPAPRPLPTPSGTLCACAWTGQSAGGVTRLNFATCGDLREEVVRSEGPVKTLSLTPPLPPTPTPSSAPPNQSFTLCTCTTGGARAPLTVHLPSEGRDKPARGGVIDGRGTDASLITPAGAIYKRKTPSPLRPKPWCVFPFSSQPLSAGPERRLKCHFSLSGERATPPPYWNGHGSTSAAPLPRNAARR